jgi:hypothetical protein
MGGEAILGLHALYMDQPALPQAVEWAQVYGVARSRAEAESDRRQTLIE